MTLLLAIVVPVAFVGGLAGSRAVMTYALRRGVLDSGGERRLHRGQVPRGGGVAIVVTVVTVQLVAMLLLPSAAELGAAWLLIGLGFAALGWLDDHRDTSAALRLAVQLALATWFVARYGAGADGAAAPLRAALFAGQVLALVWAVNLYNFMDGIDGLAACGAVLLGCVATLLFVAGGHPGPAPAALALAAASAGFLRWNWPPARLFMGDAGSTFMGYLLAALVMLAAGAGLPGAALLVVLAPLVVDATLTLLRRLVRREPFWQAHHSHLYQCLVRAGASHRAVTVAYVAVMGAVLGPAALAAVRAPALAPVILVAVYALLALAWLVAYRVTAVRLARHG